MKLPFASAAGAAILLAMSIPASASAEGFEGNLLYNFIDEDSISLGAIGLRGGLRTTWWGVEGEASWGIEDDTVAGAKVEMRHQFAGYGVLNWQASDQVDLFA